MTNCLYPSEEFFYLAEEKTIHRLKITDGNIAEKSTTTFNNTIVSAATTEIGEIIVKGFTNCFGPIPILNFKRIQRPCYITVKLYIFVDPLFSFDKK